MYIGALCFYLRKGDFFHPFVIHLSIIMSKLNSCFTFLIFLDLGCIWGWWVIFITPFYRHILISRPQSPCLLLFPASVAAVRLFRPQSPLFVFSGLNRRCLVYYGLSRRSSFIPASTALFL